MNLNESFTRNNETYYLVGCPADYFYDFGMIPISSDACTDILEKNRFIVALHEFFSTDNENLDKHLPKKVIEDLKQYFSNYDSFSLSHWNLLIYEKADDDSEGEDFPDLYMSLKQMEENNTCLDAYINEITQIFKNNMYPIDSLEELLKFYQENF